MVVLFVLHPPSRLCLSVRSHRWLVLANQRGASPTTGRPGRFCFGGSFFVFRFSGEGVAYGVLGGDTSSATVSCEEGVVFDVSCGGGFLVTVTSTVMRMLSLILGIA